jgi:hypothetical protein
VAYKQDSITAGAVHNRLAGLRAGHGVAAAAAAKPCTPSRWAVMSTAVALRLARALELAVEAIVEVEAGPRRRSVSSVPGWPTRWMGAPARRWC